MKKYCGFIVTLLIAVSLTLAGAQQAEAKRFGGARSFGSKPSYSSPYRKPASNPARSYNQQKAYGQNQAARQTMSKRGGLMGLLGGLALGGLLGAMFFGGAFEGLNFMDILVFGAIAYLLYRLFAAKSQPARSSSYERSNYNKVDTDYADAGTRHSAAAETEPARFNTDLLFKKGKAYNASERQNNTMPDAGFETGSVPEDFDRPAFLAGAKSAFAELQSAWDNKDLAEIRSLTTDKVFAEIQQQIKEDTGENHTEILRVDAELLDYREIGSQLEVVVLFDSVLREEYNGQAQQVREIWHFTRSKNSKQPTWFLDGIQQMET